MASRIVWFARGGGIARMGPFGTQVEAVNALRLTADERVYNPVRQRFMDVPRRDRFPPDAFVWPEEVEEDDHGK